MELIQQPNQILADAYAHLASTLTGADKILLDFLCASRVVEAPDDGALQQRFDLLLKQYGESLQELSALKENLDEVERDREYFRAKCETLLKEVKTTTKPSAPVVVKTNPVPADSSSVIVRKTAVFPRKVKPAAPPLPSQLVTIVAPASTPVATIPVTTEDEPHDDELGGRVVTYPSGVRVRAKDPHQLEPLAAAQALWFIHKGMVDDLTALGVDAVCIKKLRELYAEELAGYAEIQQFYKIGAYKQSLQAKIQKEGVRRYAGD